MSNKEIILAPHNYNHPAFRAPEEEKDHINIDLPLFQQYLNTSRKYPNETFIAHRAGLATQIKPPKDKYEELTYKQSAVVLRDVQRILTQIGVQDGDRVGIYAQNSPLWLLTDLAITSLNAISASFYDTLGTENIIYCVNLVKCAYIVTSINIFPQIVALSHLMPALKGILVLGNYAGQEEKILNKAIQERERIDTGVTAKDDTHSLYSMGTQLQSVLGSKEPEIDKDSLDSQILQYLTDIIERKSDKLKVEIIGAEYNDLSEDRAEEALKELENSYQNIKQDVNDVAAALFTSGTSGFPKTVLLSHRNICASMYVCGHLQRPGRLSRTGKQTRILCYLPQAHAFERAESYGAICVGMAIFFGSGDIRRLAEDMKLSQPTMMIGVPRVYTKMYNGFLQKLQKKSIVARSVFWTAWNIKKFYLKVRPSAYRTGKMPVVDAIFKPIIQALGGKMEFIVSGSSTMPAQVRDFLRICTGAQLSIGYGMTETCCTGLYNHAGQHYYEQGEAGHCSYETVTKLVDASAICEFSLEKDKIGELCIKGPAVSLGYLDGEWGKIKKHTDNDGFYHTGDLGKLMPDQSASFVRRINFVVKLQQGEFVDLEKIEQVLESDPLIQSALVHAEPDKSAPIAILSLDGAALKARVKNTDNIDEINKYAAKLCDELIRNSGLKAFNIPKACYCQIDVDWSTDPNLLTPTQKKRRTNFANKYAKEIAVMWDVLDKQDAGHTQKFECREVNKIIYKIFAILCFLCALRFFISKQ